MNQNTSPLTASITVRRAISRANGDQSRPGGGAGPRCGGLPRGHSVPYAVIKPYRRALLTAAREEPLRNRAMLVPTYVAAQGAPMAGDVDLPARPGPPPPYCSVMLEPSAARRADSPCAWPCARRPMCRPRAGLPGHGRARPSRPPTARCSGGATPGRSRSARLAPLTRAAAGRRRRRRRCGR